MRITAIVAVLIGAQLGVVVAVRAETPEVFERRKAASIKEAEDRTAASMARIQQQALEEERQRAETIAGNEAARIEAEKQKREERAAMEEAARQREAGAVAAAAKQAERLGDVHWARPLRSAQYCVAARERAATVAEIAKEKKLARLAGVLDLEMMREYQNTVRDDDETMATARQELAGLKAKRMHCSDRLVSRIAACLDGYLPQIEEQSPEACRDPEILEYARLTRDIQGP